MQIDVIIPCYNYARYLRGCVQSVLEQPDVQVRVLIIDDCSPDNTPEVGGALAAEDARVEYRRHATNLRHIATYNEGFQWASGDATLLLSADDLLTPGALVRAARVLSRHSDVGLVWGRQIVFAQEVPRSPQIDEPDYEFITGPDFVGRMCCGGSNPVNTPTAVVRTQVLKQVGGYSHELPHTADMEYWLRVAARASVCILAAEQACKRMHGQNMQVEFVMNVRCDLEQCLAAFDSFFVRDGHLIPAAARLHATARQALARQAFWAASAAFDRGDRAQCVSLLEFARGLDATLPEQRCWSRLAWKRRLGPRVWQMFRPLVERIRPTAAV